MKRFILSAFLLAIFFAGNAQHTLSFNRALLVSSTQTVPDSTVWKVVSLLANSGPLTNQSSNGSSIGPATGTFAINVNSVPIYFASVQSTLSNTYSDYEFTYTSTSGDGKLPIWLPAGTTLAASTNIQYVSVLEFIVN